MIPLFLEDTLATERAKVLGTIPDVYHQDFLEPSHNQALLSPFMGIRWISTLIPDAASPVQQLFPALPPRHQMLLLLRRPLTPGQ